MKHLTMTGAKLPVSIQFKVNCVGFSRPYDVECLAIICCHNVREHPPEIEESHIAARNVVVEEYCEWNLAAFREDSQVTARWN